MIDFAIGGAGHAVVEATAGSGKTATLLAIAEHLPGETRALFVAFNRSIKNELAERLPPRATAHTAHALGLETLAQELKRRGQRPRKPDGRKYNRLVEARMRSYFSADLRAAHMKRVVASEFVQSAVQAMREYLVDPSNHLGVASFVGDRIDTLPPFNERPGLIAIACDVVDDGMSGALNGEIDFVDMMFVPWRLGLPSAHTYDLVCVDEAQDTTPLILETVLRAGHESSRYIFVGDSHQAIYGFAGADPRSMDRIRERIGATVLPLSVTYRCPRSHVRLANQFSPDMRSASMLGDGTVRLVRASTLHGLVEPGDLVLSRTNAPLVRLAIELVARGKAVQVSGGRSIVSQLKRYAKSAFEDRLDAWQHQLASYRRVVEELGERDEQAPEINIAERQDWLDCLADITATVVAQNGTSLDDLIAAIEQLFVDSRHAVRLSTIHRAKGLEADTVFIVEPQNLPHPLARSAKEREEEQCVQFVAATRSKRELGFVVDDATFDGWKDHVPPTWWGPYVTERPGEGSR